MEFASREDAGRQLARSIEQHPAQPDLVLGLPRGGVIVAAEVAKVLRRPLDVLLVRKIGHPHQREFAVGALAEPEVVLLNHQVIEATHVDPDELDEIIEEEKERLRGYRQLFEGRRPPEITNKTVLLVDDGLATGSSMQAAVQSARQRKARQVWVAVPVASDHSFQLLGEQADQMFALLVDPYFEAVGRYYRVFEQTTDREVLAALEENRGLFQAR
jgi:predicted phosphoribosyltransferase